MRYFRGIIRGVSALALGAVGLALVGQAARDAGPALTVLFYLPLVPIALASIAADLCAGGRTLGRRARFGASIVSAVVAAAGAWSMTGTRAGEPCPAGREAVRVVQWNVRWGGGAGRTPETWQRLSDEVLARRPDVVVFSEAPERAWVDDFVRRAGGGSDAGGGWSAQLFENEPGAAHWYRVAVCSRWPVRVDGRHALANGAAFAAVVEPPGRGPIRVLAVDGVSHPGVDRRPFLRGVADVCRRLAADGRPVDWVAGDFNAPWRGRGFDDVRGGGFTPCSAVGWGWRGTYPAGAPLYDIDHVLVGKAWGVAGCGYFSAGPANHRAIVADVWRR